MRTYIFFIVIYLVPLVSSFGQRINKYNASNGVEYQEGDTVNIGIGSGNNGDFVYLTMGGWLYASSTEKPSVPKAFSNSAVVIKKMRKYKIKGRDAVWFTVRGGNITNYTLQIEQAISVCEVIPCIENKEPSDKYDDLIKLKSLLDSGAITEKEYELEKKKILNKN